MVPSTIHKLPAWRLPNSHVPSRGNPTTGRLPKKKHVVKDMGTGNHRHISNTIGAATPDPAAFSHSTTQLQTAIRLREVRPALPHPATGPPSHACAACRPPVPEVEAVVKFFNRKIVTHG